LFAAHPGRASRDPGSDNRCEQAQVQSSFPSHPSTPFVNINREQCAWAIKILLDLESIALLHRDYSYVL
jgi:hypothetical protein